MESGIHKQTDDKAPGADRRGDARFSVALRGRLVMLAGRMRPCTVVNIGAGGAALRCHMPGAAGRVTLHLDGSALGGGLDRLDGVVIAALPGGILHLAFTGDGGVRRAVAAALLRQVQAGLAQVLAPRRQGRIVMDDFHVLRANGEKLSCMVLDISLHGICLRTAARPPVGEQVVVQGRAGRVVRHHDQGIAIRLLTDADLVASHPVRHYQGQGITGPSALVDDHI